MRVGLPRTPQERLEALACLLGAAGDPGRVDEALALADAGEIDLSGLAAVWRGGTALSAALYCIAPDGSAFVWPPEFRRGTAARHGVEVLEFLLAQASSSGCGFAQAAVEPERADHRAALEAAGFRFLTDLLYLQRPLDASLPRLALIDGRVVPFTASAEQRFAAVIERTYVGSRDCPGFHGLRSPAQALRSYRPPGGVVPSRWCVVERGAADAAVILVNDRPDERAREIVYLGVVPEARRSGLGNALVLRALHEARADGCGNALVGVDATNLPAVNLYGRLGFFPASRRQVYLKRLAHP